MPAIDPRNIEVVDPAQAEAYRRMTAAERVAIIGSVNRAARKLIAAGAKTLHPEWTQEAVQAEVARRMTLGSARSAAACRADA